MHAYYACIFCMHARIICTHIMHAYHACILCMMHAYYACILCMHIMHAYCACILCMHIMHAYYACISCMHCIHAYYACILCMHFMHACIAVANFCGSLIHVSAKHANKKTKFFAPGGIQVKVRRPHRFGRGFCRRPRGRKQVFW